MIRKLASYIREYKRDAILAPVFVALEVVMDILIPLIMANMIDYGISGGSMPDIWRYGLWLILMCVFSLITGAVSGRLSARASTGFAKNLRGSVYARIQDFSFANIDKYSTPGLVTRLTTDVTNVQNAFQMIIRTVARAPLMIIFSVVMTFTINARLAWIFLAAIPVLTAGLYLIIKNANPIFQRVFKLYDRLNNVVQENIKGIRVVKSFVRERHETDKFTSASGDIHDNFVKAEKILAFNSPLMQICMYGCTLLICWFGAQMIVSETFSTGQLMSLLTYTTQILISLMMLSMVFVMVTMARASAERVVEILDEAPEMTDGAAGLHEPADGSIEFENVSFGYRGEGGALCLRDISLKIGSGQTVGIVGGTGSGKSTLTQLIPRLYDATAGRVLVGGADVRDYEMHALREEVAMVLQKNTLFAGSVAENLRWGNKDASEDELRRACRLAQADEFVSALPEGCDSHVEQGGANLSGGQKQRLCIARALIKRPRILILDDSTSAVDTATDALIRRAFREEIPDTTKIIIAQRVSSVMEADMIVVMDGGRIDAVGTHGELLENSDIYREVFLSQQKGGLSDEVA